MRIKAAIALALLSVIPGVADCKVEHLIFPVPGAPRERQAILHRTFELNQSCARRIAWGISGRFAGIDPLVKPNHMKFGVELYFVFEDGTSDWFRPARKFSSTAADWQHISGVYTPHKKIRKVIFFYRIATPGEAWYDGATLFELPDAATLAGCRLAESGERLTLENDFVSCTVAPREGAVLTSLIDRKSGVDCARGRGDGKLLKDGVSSGGDQLDGEWSAEVVSAADEEVCVEMHCTNVKGAPFLEVSKRIALKRDSPVVEVSYAWRNQPASMANLKVSPWIADIFMPCGDPGGFFLPTERGVLAAGLSDDLDLELAGGWCGAATGGGRMMAAQFDWHRHGKFKLVKCAGGEVSSRLEFAPFEIPAGGSMQTAVEIFPVAARGRYDWVENGFYASFSLTGTVASVEIGSAVAGVFNVEFAVGAKDGEPICKRKTLSLSPGDSALLDLPVSGRLLQNCAVRVFSDGALVFEAERFFDGNRMRRARRIKAKPVGTKPFELKVGRGIQTPHTVFAKPYAGGVPRVLFLTSIHQAREISELLQRFEMKAHAIRLAYDENTTSWSMAEQFGSYGYREMNDSLKRMLDRRFDVILVSGSILKAVDKDNLKLIDRQVADGAGLVRIGRVLPALAGDASDYGWIAGNVPKELLPFGAGNVRAATVGGHREVMLDYEARLGLTPFVPYSSDIPAFRYQDYSLGVVGRAILWAAKMDMRVPSDAKTVMETVQVEPGFEIRHKFWKGPEGVFDWAVEARHFRKESEFTKFVVDDEDKMHHVGGFVKGEVGVTSGVAKLALSDGYGREISAVSGVDGKFSLPIPEAATGMLFIDALLEFGGKTADVRRAKIVCKRDWRRSEYPLALSEDWLTDGGEKEYLLKHRVKVYRELGINMIRFWNSSYTAGFRHVLPYGFDLDFPIYDARISQKDYREKFSEPYAKTKDKRYLCRQPCLNDPAYRKELDARIRANVERISCFSPVTCDCGDENSLTLWDRQLDFCFGEHTLKAFRRWLRGEYASLDALNSAWRTAFPSWDDVVPDTTEEARGRAERTGVKSYAAWADHRRFMELTFCETIERVAGILHERLPEVPLDMSGTQPPNGWTGMDMYLISRFVGEPASYSGDSRSGYLGELIRSFSRPYVKPWVGYGTSPDVIAFRMWDYAFRYLDCGANFWTCFNFLLPDYSPAPAAVQYGRTGEELRRGTARLLRSLECRPEALIHYSYASIHAAQIERRYGDFLDCGERWRRALIARSKPYRYVAYGEIEDGVLEKTSAKILILPRSAALSDKEAAAIRKFASRGGKVFGDRETGRMDQHCAVRSKPVLRDLIVDRHDFNPGLDDGVTVYKLFPRDGAEGRYWGLTRDWRAGDDERKRTLASGKPAFFYDLKNKKFLGKTDRIDVSLKASSIEFVAALPYAVGPVAAIATSASPGESVKVEIRSGVPETSRACHPVIVDVYAPGGERHRLYSGVCDASGGSGVYSFRTALNDCKGIWRVVVTDYITGADCCASFALQEKP